MSDWGEIFLGIIAVASLATAFIQIAVLIAAGRLARRLTRLVDHAEQELKPILGHLNAIGRDASRATSLAAAQVERADRLFADVVRRVETSLDSVQTAIVRPAREGAALLSGFRAALHALRDLRAGRARARSEDEDTLFI